jgi:hypothetical protein
MNKYERWYSTITTRAKDRTLNGYKERHHIIPHSLGGSDTLDNLVDLTAREHFICHWLLTKMYTGEARGKMINAMYMMRGQSTHQKRYQSKITGRIYESLREEYSQYISKLNTGRIQPPEEKARQLAAQIGRKRAPFSKEWLANIKEARQGEKNGMYGKQHSEETKLKQRLAKLGKKQSPETIAKRTSGKKGKPCNRPKGIYMPTLRKFTSEQVKEIRKLKANGLSYSKLQALFPASVGVLQRIISRESYADVE